MEAVDVEVDDARGDTTVAIVKHLGVHVRNGVPLEKGCDLAALYQDGARPSARLPHKCDWI